LIAIWNDNSLASKRWRGSQHVVLLKQWRTRCWAIDGEGQAWSKPYLIWKHICCFRLRYGFSFCEQQPKVMEGIVVQHLLSNLSVIATLVVMEGLLSVDNALVLATMARRLRDPVEQKHSLTWGMFGAVTFRAIFIMLGVVLVKLWWIKVVGGLYLLHIATEHFRAKSGEPDQDTAAVERFRNTFVHRLLGRCGIVLSPLVSVIISIELMDVAFSADSILAALALSENFWVLFVGGVLGIIMMRGVAQLFMALTAKIPEMEHTAFILIYLIAAKMLVGTVHIIGGLVGVELPEIHVAEPIFFGVVALTFGLTFVVHHFRRRQQALGQ